MSWIQVNQVQTIEAAPLPASVQYRLAIEVTVANGIEPELFVFTVTDDAYQYPATLGDLTTYPNNKAEAQANDQLFYRASKMSIVFSTQAVAAVASTSIQQRLAKVNRDWGMQTAAPFGGVETFVYDSGQP